MSPREKFTQQIERWLGWPYVWGKQNPIQGFDCSGIEVAAFWTTGFWGRQIRDRTAQEIWKLYAPVRVTYPYRGCLIFWHSTKGLIKHTEVCVGENEEGEPMCVGARQSYKRVVETRLDESRGKLELAGYVDPFLFKIYAVKVE